MTGLDEVKQEEFECCLQCLFSPALWTFVARPLSPQHQIQGYGLTEMGVYSCGVWFGCAFVHLDVEALPPPWILLQPPAHPTSTGC